MPINIFRDIEPSEKIVRLCLEDWELPTQVVELERWLNDSQNTIAPGKIIADIGFSVREGALGGGAVLTAESMKKFADMGVDLYFSEYDSSTEETD